MKNRSFDHIVKSKLDNYNIEVDPSAWDLFEAHKVDAFFDQSIQNNVSDYHLEVFPKDWDVLEQKYLLDEPVDEFDALIGAKLANVAVFESADWSNFEKILDQKDTFDEEISSKVRNHEVPLNTSQWPKLSEHLENIERSRRRIVITKFVEAAIFILFVLSIMQLYPIENIKKTNIYRTVSVNNNLQNPQQVPSSQIAEVNDLIVPESKITTEVRTETSNGQVPNNSRIAIVNRIDARVLDLASANNSQFQNQEEALGKGEISTSVVINTSIDPIMKDAYGLATVSEALHSAASEEHVQKASFSNINLLTSIDLSALDYSKEYIQFPISLDRPEIKRGQFWINTYGSPDANLISTPYDDFYKSDGYQNDAYGYSLGTSASYETNNWELEAGLEYSSLNYYPKGIIETTGSAIKGYTETTLKEIILDIVEVPLNFKYKLFRKNGWTLYASSGISLGLVASAKYDINEESNAPLASSKPGLTFTPSLQHYTILDKKEFDEGLINQGSLTNNIFFTMNTGIGVSKKISDSISFYAQPTYHHNLSVGGLGPNNDVHNRLSMQIGTKIRI